LPLWPRGTSRKPPQHDPPDYPLFQGKPYQNDNHLTCRICGNLLGRRVMARDPPEEPLA
jgi:hypothetical protein